MSSDQVRAIPGPVPRARPALVHGRQRDACPARHAPDVHRGQDGSYHVEAGLPGADPDSVEVTVEHAVLTIQAERTPHYGDSDQVLAAERPQGCFARQLSLGEAVDSQNLTAGYADGVLHVTIPASPKAQARRVEVTRAAGGCRVVPGSTAEPGQPPAGGTGGGAG